jgi:hypothetical protein
MQARYPGRLVADPGTATDGQDMSSHLTSREVRARLEEALRLDLVGPWPGSDHAAEELPEAPSHWYVTGFLVPNEAPTEQKEDPTADEQLDLGVESAAGDDDAVPEKPSARRGRLPSSIGIRVLVVRPSATSDDDSTITTNFLKTFRKKDWPWEAVPEVYFDPRSLAPNAAERSVLHAKCIVADDRRVFVTSANFTEAAHERNIEAGLLLENLTIAQALTRQFESLVHAGVLKRLFL